MKIILSIIFNAFILYIMFFLLNTSKEVWITVEWWFKTYLIWWTLLWILNTTIRPILKIVTLPLFLLLLWLVTFIVNGWVLYFFEIFINILDIPWVVYKINWWINLIISIAIFTILNMIYPLLFSKD
jgi:uncharacterized membrane protein YvlD (DUF360 family)